MTRLFIAAGFAAILSSAASAQAVPVRLSEWKVVLPRDTFPAGPVTFRVKNEGTMVHGFHVEGPGVDKDAPQIPAGQSASLTVTLKPGTYELYCPLADQSHKMAGMTKKITVTGGAPAAAPKKPSL
jgi:plastocyanin